MRQLERRLTPAREAAPEPPGLGYRGFVYSDASGRVRVYRGYVKTPRAVLADPSFSIERYLRDQLPAEYAELRNMASGGAYAQVDTPLAARRSNPTRA